MGSLTSLKDIPAEKLDLVFSSTHDIVFKNYDCLSCANCCRNYSPIIELEEIVDLSFAIGVSTSALFQNYVEMDEDGDFVFKSQPCPMLNLEDNKCRIYKDRPRACREYPHTNMKGIKNHLGLLEKNIEICPAAEEIFSRVVKAIEHVKA
ncbi:MAG: YkgJ family cysteine cluster protein [Chitinophagales bacterium]|nr:YkgJ family cysteine cluster protein [Chitinophagales bacterium]